MIDSKLKSLSETDITITEYVEDIRQDYYSALMHIIISSIINISFCLCVIAVYDNELHILAPFFMTESIIVFFFIMIELIRFVCYLNPKAIREKGSIDKDFIDSEYAHKSDSSESNEKFSPFITYYNLLEKLIKDLACHVLDSPNAGYKLQIFDALNVLLRHEIINREIYSTIDEFRRYRNALVHSLDTDKSVNLTIYNKLCEIYRLLKDIYDAQISDNNNEFINKRNYLLSYSKAQGYNEIDRKIIDYLSKHPNSSLRDLSNHTNYNIESIRRSISNLQRMGAVIKTETGRQTKWQVNSNIL